MRPAVIELKNVWKEYQMGPVRVPALKGVDLAVHKGEFLAITGPSGSGKSTMVNLVGCLDTPTRGTISLGGRNIATMHESERAQLRGKLIGFVFQQFNLLPTLTAVQNVMLPLELQDEDSAGAEKKAVKLLESLGLGERLHHLPTQLSGGQQQRVAVARALVCEPEVLLADEPTGNLDSHAGQDVLSLLKKFWKDGKTVVMITHEPEFAALAQTQIVLRDGEIVKRKTR